MPLRADVRAASAQFYWRSFIPLASDKFRIFLLSRQLLESQFEACLLDFNGVALQEEPPGAGSYLLSCFAKDQLALVG